MNSLPLSCHGDANSSLPPLEERNDDVALNSLPLSCFTDGGGDEKRHVRPPTAGFEADGGDRPVYSRSYGGVEYSAMAGTTMIFYNGFSFEG